MYSKRIVKIAGPSLLLLGSVMVFSAMRANVAPSTADASPPYEESAADRPGLGQASKGPLFNRSANEQRAAQTRILEQILIELRATRELLASGDARVRVESIELDYDRMASFLESAGASGSGSSSPAPDASDDGSAPASSNGSGSGSIRRISLAGSGQVNEVP